MRYGARPGPMLIPIAMGGHVWRPRHRVFEGEMKMWVEVNNDQISFMPGEWVTGRVLCNFQEAFESKILTLQFIGEESTWFMRQGFNTELRHQFLNM